MLVLLAIPVGISGAVVARSDAAASWQPRDPSVQADWPTVATPEDADPRQVA